MDYYHKYQKYRLKYLNLLNKSGGSNNNNNNNADVTAAAATTNKNNNNSNVNDNDNYNVQLKKIIDDYNKKTVIVDVKIIVDLLQKVKNKEDYITLLEILKIKQFNTNQQVQLLNMDITTRRKELSKYDIQQNQEYKDKKVQEKQDLITKLKELNDTEFNKIIDSDLKDKEYYYSLIKYIVDKYSNEKKILDIDSETIISIASKVRDPQLEDKLFELLKIKQYDNKTQSEILKKSPNDLTRFLNQFGGMDHLKFKIFLFDFEEDKKQLKDLDDNHFSEDQYYKICKVALTQNLFQFKYVNAKKLSTKFKNKGDKIVYDEDEEFIDQYYYIALEAINKIFSVLLSYDPDDLVRFKNKYSLTDVQLANEIYEIFLLAVKNNKIFLYHANQIKHLITPEQYYNICVAAVENDIKAQEYVDHNKFRLNGYSEKDYKILEKKVKTFIKKDRSKTNYE
jgi:hypothetical protein